MNNKYIFSFFFSTGLGKGEAPPPPPPASTPRTPSAEETAESVNVNVGLNISEVSHFFFWQSVETTFRKLACSAGVFWVGETLFVVVILL